MSISGTLRDRKGAKLRPVSLSSFVALALLVAMGAAGCLQSTANIETIDLENPKFDQVKWDSGAKWQ